MLSECFLAMSWYFYTPKYPKKSATATPLNMFFFENSGFYSIYKKNHDEYPNFPPTYFSPNDQKVFPEFSIFF
jgi:hypothetical protein